MNWLLALIFGCPHERESWPLKPRNRAGVLMRARPSYTVCLRCGRERDYTLLDVQERSVPEAEMTEERA